MDDSTGGDVGVATALGRICALEAKLRQAIQHTHLLSSSFESDPAAADREREALLAIRLQRARFLLATLQLLTGLNC